MMVVLMQDNGRMGSNMEVEGSLILMVSYMRENGNKASEVAMANL